MSNTIAERFIQATRNKTRIATTRGILQVEDLWDLSLPSLDHIAVKLDEEIQKRGRKSFIGKTPQEAPELNDALEIVKHVIDTKIAEAEAAKIKAQQTSQVSFLKGLLEKKKLSELEGMTTEQITAKLAELGVTV
jgi:hypothetical protein